MHREKPRDVWKGCATDGTLSVYRLFRADTEIAKAEQKGAKRLVTGLRKNRSILN